MTDKTRHTVIPRTMCLVFNRDKLLLIKASKEKEFSGYYDPPGGHVEKGESIIETAEREIFEETGMKVTSTKLRGVVHVSGFYGKDIMLFVTISKALSTTIKTSEEGEPQWFSMDELDKINLFEDMRPIIKHVLSMKPNDMFFGTSKFDGKDKLESFDIKVY